MFEIERWQEIFETLRKNKLRTCLTGLSVASGIFILVILLGFSRGIQNGVTSEFEQDATNSINVWPGVTTKEYKGLNPGRRVQLKMDDYADITNKFGDHIDLKSAGYSIWGGTISYNGQFGNYRVEGVYPDKQFIENSDIINGRFINNTDVVESRKVAVIGNKVKTDLFKESDPLGQQVSVNGMNFMVVGVFSDPGGEREETRVYLPLSSAQKVFNASNDIRNIEVTVKMSKNFNEAVELSNSLTQGISDELKARHMIAPDDQNAIRVNGTLAEAKKIYTLIDTISAVFWFVGIGTIIAGIVGVGNIMIIIVKERTKEIGIRKAIGALPSSIVGMILQEAIFVTMFSGLFGLITGLGLLELVGPQIQSDFIKHPQVDFQIALATVFILVFAGGLAGFIPAYRASRIKPIVALRDE
ncbi:ABC transporter permease [Aegicerativicinus sediminis]